MQLLTILWLAYPQRVHRCVFHQRTVPTSSDTMRTYELKKAKNLSMLRRGRRATWRKESPGAGDTSSACMEPKSRRRPSPGCGRSRASILVMSNKTRRTRPCGTSTSPRRKSRYPGQSAVPHERVERVWPVPLLFRPHLYTLMGTR